MTSQASGPQTDNPFKKLDILSGSGPEATPVSLTKLSILGSSGPESSSGPGNISGGKLTLLGNSDLAGTSGPGNIPGKLSILGTSGPNGLSGPGDLKLASTLGISGPADLSKLVTTSGSSGPGGAQDFIDAMKAFNDGRSREMMDWLEWDQNHDQAQRHNGRFGTNGMLLLSQLDPNSPKWEQGADDLGVIPVGERQRFIDAAKTALKPENKALLDQVHGGDGIFEWNDIPNWLDKQPDGKIGPFSQGSEGDCWLLASLDAMNNDKDGREKLSKMVTLNKDGSYMVGFPDANIRVTQEQINQGPHSSGDMDVAIIETAARNLRGSINGGSDTEGLELLTGVKAKGGETGPGSIQWRGNPATTRDTLRQWVEQDKDGISMVFSDTIGKTGHQWSVRDINFETDTVTYVNPWHTDKLETMSIDDLLKKRMVVYTEVLSGPVPAPVPPPPPPPPPSPPASGRFPAIPMPTPTGPKMVVGL